MDEFAPEPTRAFNYDFFRAGERECTAEAIAGAVQAYPVIAETRVVVIRGMEDAREEIGAELARQSSSPAGSTVLLMMGEKLDARRKWVSSLMASAMPFTLATPKGRAFTAWLRRRAKRMSVDLSEAAADMIIEFVGSDVHRAASELEKVAVFIAPRLEITVEDVETVGGGDARGHDLQPDRPRRRDEDGERAPRRAHGWFSPTSIRRTSSG